MNSSAVNRPEEIASAEAHYHQAQANLEKLERGNRREDIDLAKAAYAYDEAVSESARFPLLRRHR